MNKKIAELLGQQPKRPTSADLAPKRGANPNQLPPLGGEEANVQATHRDNEAKRNGSRLPVTALVDQFYADVQAMGGQRWDTSSLVKRLR